MNRLRLMAAAVAMTMLVSVVGAGFLSGTAAAAPGKRHANPHHGSITASIPCTSLGAADTCALNINNLQMVNGALEATGTVTNSAGTISAPFQAPLSVVDPCTLLDLTLGPLHLNLLGLVVDLNQVHLTLTAVQGPGNLLGNLLCSVAHLLDGTGLGNALQSILNLVNQILGNLNL